MNDPIFWPTVVWGLACFAVFYGRALVIERRQNHHRRVRLRNQLRG